ncbi:putative cell survival pathways protein [Friedmanniomyces endolithicus]|uniref:Cell survival pathways protein n=1 Tax=Friedmanniomyces endolithicus TaxID=329885 RepID=A0AAN6J959_9PEZI|nr:putative cell survival pathways protein [Friedmanniomyces endolithicus]KAK0287776.1 putative cell survival pathways protein [Friedmanniomyces endolithicus]KAK0314931.1 putative cell survival pathways protein [Friedmanniomyces endolithicus]KAK0994651.1 putative cell survival pathways protein [Friedmanniomyces endolithicus]
MFNWAKNAVGITEPVYGPSAIQSVAEQTHETPYSEVTKDDLAWEVMDTTNVETKVFYMTSESGHIGLLQIIYSNVLGVRTTAQFNTKILYPPEQGKPHLWCSDNISNFDFSPDKQDFKSTSCTMTLSSDGQTYHIKSTLNPHSAVDITFTRTSPGFKAGRTGTTTFGTSPDKPWGRMRHLTWPRCRVEGSIMTQSGPVDFAGRGLFNHALQGMKPHFAAAKWNFCNFQSETYSAFLMEFTTPESYGKTSVCVGCVAVEGRILFGGATPGTSVRHTEVRGDPENEWPEPGAVEFRWEGKGTEGGEGFEARLAGSLGKRVDRIDVMGELPKFVKQIVVGASGTKPYIYQYTPKMTLEINGEKEEGRLFMESTFIS